VQAIAKTFGHERVIRRVELDLVAAEALGVERPQLGRVLIGGARRLEGRGRAPTPAELRQRRRLPACPIGGDRVAQRRIAREQVHVPIGRRLVHDVVGVEALRHGNLPEPAFYHGAGTPVDPCPTGLALPVRLPL
jgi:hypothetical protein